MPVNSNSRFYAISSLFKQIFGVLKLFYVFVIIPICATILILDVDMALGEIGVVTLQLLEIAPVFLGDGMMIDVKGI